MRAWRTACVWCLSCVYARVLCTAPPPCLSSPSPHARLDSAIGQQQDGTYWRRDRIVRGCPGMNWFTYTSEKIVHVSPLDESQLTLGDYFGDLLHGTQKRGDFSWRFPLFPRRRQSSPSSPSRCGSRCHPRLSPARAARASQPPSKHFGEPQPRYCSSEAPCSPHLQPSPSPTVRLLAHACSANARAPSASGRSAHVHRTWSTLTDVRMPSLVQAAARSLRHRSVMRGKFAVYPDMHWKTGRGRLPGEMRRQV